MSTPPYLDRDSVRAMPFRPALPMNRAAFHRLGLSVGIAIALSGCGPQTGEKAKFQDGNPNLPANAYLRIWTDPDSGCRYYIYQEGAGQYVIGGMTIRFRRDGSADCPPRIETVSK